MRNWYAWDVDRGRRFLRIDEAARTADGSSVQLFPGANLPPGTRLTVRVAHKGLLPDFAYSIGLHLFVSGRVKDAILSAGKVSGTFHPIEIRHKNELLGHHWWVNLKTSTPVMDRVRSRFLLSAVTETIIRRVEYFAVDQSRVPDEPLFLCDELLVPVFSEDLVGAFRSLRVTGAVFYPLEGLVWP
jgi:hypothetical protein